LQILGLELDQKDTKDITDVQITFGQLEKCVPQKSHPSHFKTYQPTTKRVTFNDVIVL